MSLAPGTQFGPYATLSLLGAGGMGEVYLARDTRLGRKVALKLLADRYTEDPSRVRRFEQEACAASALNHPNIVTIHDIGEAETGRFIVMEAVEGRTLRTLIGEPTPVTTLAKIGGQIAKALGAQAGERCLREVVESGGFTRFRRATETPFNLILEARP